MLDEMKIFIGGSGRSGTTLVLSLIASHPEFIGYLETKFLVSTGGLNDYLDDKVDLDVFKKNFFAKYASRIRPWKPGYYLADPPLLDFIEELFTTSYSSNNKLKDSAVFIDNLLSFPLDNLKEKYWVEKTPNSIVMVDKLFFMFPTIKYIHVIREPKDIYASLSKTYWGPKSVPDFTVWYCSIMKKAYQAQKNVPANNYLVVNLEDLVSGDTKIDQLFSFLNVSFESKNQSAIHDILKPENAHIDRWKEEITNYDADSIDKECKDLYLAWREHVSR